MRLNMKSSLLSQSKFYHPALNSAIFDGPFRIYFAKPQEVLALKIYFKIQEAVEESLQETKNLFKVLQHSLYIMLYPNEQSLSESFDIHRESGKIPMEILDHEFVLGLNGEVTEDSEIDLLIRKIQIIVNDWKIIASEVSVQNRPKDDLVSL